MVYQLPYQFILRELYPLRPKIKKGLGGYLLYLDKKLILFLRERDNQPEFNGVFVATQPVYLDMLKEEIHDANLEFDLDGTTDSWLFINSNSTEFEEKVKKACSLLKINDERLGR